MRVAKLFLLAALTTVPSGCGTTAYFFRDTHAPMQALEVRMDPAERRDCVVVLMPGMFDVPDDYLTHGFAEDARAASDHCDLLAIDAHFGYYRSGALRERIGMDILRVAEARGYEHIWLVGISMGGLGAALVARDHPDEIDGVILLAPFLGDPAVTRSIRDAGGLASWHAPERTDTGDEHIFDDPIWDWLRGYVTHPGDMPALYVGVGTEDDLRADVSLLADVLPEAQHGEAEGGHKWVTWRRLWQRLMVSPPWDSGTAVPHING